ncbi:MAG: tRNA (guanosine(46)-N7)-methyltransferase TrmB [Pseudomonadota bacterium]
MSEQDYAYGNRRVRSFVRRPGRLTPGQERALAELLPRFEVPRDSDDVRRSFAGDQPLVVEIGCGNGQAMAWMAANEPQFNFLGIEVHEPGVGRLLLAIERGELNNVRVAMRDAVDVLEQQVPVRSLEQVRIYFPDPWHKKRHHKRRLIQAPFLRHLAERIRPGGLLHLATDWMPYAEWMVEALAEVQEFELLGDPYVPQPDWRPHTHFEKRGERRGHEIVDILARRV